MKNRFFSKLLKLFSDKMLKLMIIENMQSFKKKLFLGKLCRKSVILYRNFEFIHEKSRANESVY